MLKVCKTCNETKDLSEFPFNRSGKNGDNFRTNHVSVKANCKLCIAASAREWRKKNPAYRGSGKLKEIPKEDRLLASAISAKMLNCKANARARNKEFPMTVTREYLFKLFKDQKGMCAISGLVMNLEMHSEYILSLDKIEPSLGYVEGNVQWVCWCVNRAKGQMPLADFKLLCRTIVERCND